MSVDVRTEIVIDVPVERVAAYATDPATASRWYDKGRCARWDARHANSVLTAESRAARRTGAMVGRLVGDAQPEQVETEEAVFEARSGYQPDLFAEPEDALRRAVLTTWVQRIPAADKTDYPLTDYLIGERFIESLEAMTEAAAGQGDPRGGGRAQRAGAGHALIIRATAAILRWREGGGWNYAHRLEEDGDSWFVAHPGTPVPHSSLLKRIALGADTVGEDYCVEVIRSDAEDRA